MAIIGNIAVALGLRNKGFNKGLKKSSGRLAKFAKSVKVVSAAVVTAGAVAFTAGAASITSMTKSQLASIDAIAKQADSLGLATESLAGYQHAASIAGVNAEQLGKGILRMEKNISDATNGLTTAKRAFEGLGLSAEELQSKSPEQQFETIADAFGTVTNQADRARIAQDLFGRSGVAMLNMFNNGSRGIRDAVAEAEKLGLTFNRVDAAKVEMANDAVTRLRALFTGVARTLAIQVAPFIEAAANKLVDMGVTGDGVTTKIVNGLEWVVMAGAKVADAVDLVRLGFLHARRGVLLFVKFGVDSLIKLQDFASELFQTILRGAATIAEKIPGFGDKIAIGLRVAAEAHRAGTDMVQEFEKAFSDELGRAAGDIEGKINDLLIGPSASERVAKFFDDIRSEADRAAKDVVASLPSPGASVASSDPSRASAEQIVRSRVFIGSSGRSKQRTPVKADPQHIDLLQKMLLALTAPNARAA